MQTFALILAALHLALVLVEGGQALAIAHAPQLDQTVCARAQQLHAGESQPQAAVEDHDAAGLRGCGVPYAHQAVSCMAGQRDNLGHL